MSGTASESTRAENADTDGSGPVTNEELLQQIEQLEGDEKTEDIEDRRPEWVFKQFESHWRADDKAESSLQPIRSAWKQFCDWMDYKDYQYLTDLTPRFSGRHDSWVVNHDQIDKTKLSRSMHLSRIRIVVRYAERTGMDISERRARRRRLGRSEAGTRRRRQGTE